MTMYTAGINTKVGSIDLSAEQKRRLIASIENCKLPDYEDDYPKIEKVLLPRLEDSKDEGGSFDFTTLEQSFMLYTTSMSDDLDLYGYITNNSRFSTNSGYL